MLVRQSVTIQPQQSVMASNHLLAGLPRGRSVLTTVSLRCLVLTAEVTDKKRDALASCLIYARELLDVTVREIRGK